MTVKPFKIITKYYLTEFGQYAARLILLLPIGEKGNELAIEYQNRKVCCAQQELSFLWGSVGGGAHATLGEFGLGEHDLKFYRSAEFPSVYADTLADLENHIKNLSDSIRKTVKTVVRDHIDRASSLPEDLLVTYDPLIFDPLINA
jgi:hypothetical protein